MRRYSTPEKPPNFSPLMSLGRLMTMLGMLCLPTMRLRLTVKGKVCLPMMRLHGDACADDDSSESEESEELSKSSPHDCDDPKKAMELTKGCALALSVGLCAAGCRLAAAGHGCWLALRPWLLVVGSWPCWLPAAIVGDLCSQLQCRWPHGLTACSRLVGCWCDHCHQY